KAIMKDQGTALMGIGRGTGENRAADAAKAAIDSPLLEMPIDGAKGILFTITGGQNLGMYEVNEAARIITQSADQNAKIIFGAVIDEELKDEIKVTVIATGFGKGGARPQKKMVAAASSMPFEPMTTPIERPKPAPASMPSSQPSMPATPKQPTKTNEEEELEIPAFIRKKML
ncbi:MAG: cell division protein FtsZ, partial [Candidatus Kerfeldbacteria bacterium]|nr:cell division protein FtsZ [Candidatus Kerfeldbacteria bacterium]